MKKTLFICGFFAAFLLLLSLPSGCYYDNEEDRFPGTGNTCDTVGMRYSVEIREIMQDNCYQCHISSSSEYSGIPFETHAQLQEVALNGKLVDRINSAAAPMPQSGLMLACNRRKIEAWVKAGAPDN